ncbi:mannose-6-phosphate isomerase-like protein (cupin superfamily) [Friedmanniella endophytica]|uniref:Mannose-6-phosphate isomerase-like protein (Cupin superfamily) n=1 Tax=Microlunatus kandeliicorticis TaxID=1759536 RepID=A0A7W3IVS1_9ACTN|nr:cysteine dioxygenase family protein [Microlunatus kandeliicorticis]MBA8796193.1 mannose-6-phosphate isomerase-like protein (cupin superfamily) [Microlunatus kandeliicorticis]
MPYASDPARTPASRHTDRFTAPTRGSRSTRPRINLVELATRLAGQQRLWQPLVAFDPAHRHYERLAAEPDFEAWVLTWLPGQGTAWHDHGGSAGAFTVLEGRLTERTASIDPRSDLAPRIDAGFRDLDAGEVRAFGTRHLHRVTNDHLRPAVSLHVYAPALVEMNEYTPVGSRLQLTTSQLAGANW